MQDKLNNTWICEYDGRDLPLPDVVISMKPQNTSVEINLTVAQGLSMKPGILFYPMLFLLFRLPLGSIKDRKCTAVIIVGRPRLNDQRTMPWF